MPAHRRDLYRRRCIVGVRTRSLVYVLILFGASIILLTWFASTIPDDSQTALDSSLIRHQVTFFPAPIDEREIHELGTPEYNTKATEVTINPEVSLPTIKHKLRFDWTNLTVQSRIANFMLAHQTNCSLPLGNHHWRKKIFGLGSDLHVWGAALCNAMEEGVRIRTHNANPWIWIDQEKCNSAQVEASTLLCYFPRVELQCPGDFDHSKNVQFNVSNPIHVKCDKTMTSPMNVFQKSEWRAAGIELLFSRVAKVVQEEGERQLNIVFPDGVPPDLITVHMRWGDKKFENKVMGVPETMKAIETVRRQRGDNLRDPTSIFLCTEDPKAVEGFLKASPKNWKVYIDHFFNEMLPFRPEDETVYNKVPKITRSLQGKPGLWSLGSLLVAMEANAFVLVLSSNWSRVINELRRNVLNPRCHDCTFVVDVTNGKWKEW